MKKTKKNKKDLTPCGTAVGTCRRGAWRQGPGALSPEVLSCRRVPRRQGLNAVGHGDRNLPLWVMTPDVYFSNFLIRPFIFRKSKQNKYKKSSYLNFGYSLYPKY
jgi:hypothetical protein